MVRPHRAAVNFHSLPPLASGLLHPDAKTRQFPDTMRTMLLTLAVLVGAPGLAQVHVSVPVPPVPVPPVPTVTFVQPPPLVVVQPGVQVVEDHDDEVFFVDNWYWIRRDNHWYRARDHRGGWVHVDGSGVPAPLVKVPHGHYRRYKHGKKATTVVVDPPGPGKVKVKVKKH